MSDFQFNQFQKMYLENNQNEAIQYLNDYYLEFSGSMKKVFGEDLSAKISNVVHNDYKFKQGIGYTKKSSQVKTDRDLILELQKKIEKMETNYLNNSKAVKLKFIPSEKRTEKFLLRLSKSQKDKLVDFSYKNNLSINDIVLNSLDEYFKKHK